MGDHDGLGHASGTASVDQGTAVARADLFHAFLEVLGLNSNAFEHELFPVVKDSFVLGRDFEVWVVVEDDVLEISFFQQSHVLLGVLEVLSNDDFAFWMLSYVFAGLDRVCSVDSCGQTSGEDAPEKGDVPLGGVEPDQIQGGMLLHSQSNQGPSKQLALLSVLFISQRFLFITILIPTSCSVLQKAQAASGKSWRNGRTCQSKFRVQETPFPLCWCVLAVPTWSHQSRPLPSRDTKDLPLFKGFSSAPGSICRFSLPIFLSVKS